MGLTIMMKSLKLLIRSKGSALVVLLGPLLIVLIIGAGFYDTSTTQFNIGVFSSDGSELTERFITNLDTTENNVVRFDNSDTCIDSVKQGLVVTCIVFPNDFSISDEKVNEVLFYVDESRLNLVYRIISSLSLNLDLESTELTSELTAEILRIMASSSIEVSESLKTINAIESELSSSQTVNEDSIMIMNKLDVREVPLNISTASEDMKSIGRDFTIITDNAGDVVQNGYDLLDKITYNGSEVTSLFEALEDLNRSLDNTNESIAALEDISESIFEASKNVDALKRKLDNSREARLEVLDELKILSEKLDSLILNTSSVKERLEKVKTEIGSFKLSNAESIVSPITTKIEHVSTSSGKITYSFPYLLMLIVMFVGLMLSGNLIFMEKDSRAYFRNFTTPIKNYYFLTMSYLTGLIILIVQITVILLLVFLALGVPVFDNFGITFVTILLSITVFILFGMFLGYLFSTSEAITMSTIAIGSVLIFFSNLILPIETLAPSIQTITRLNPYVIASETIRKSMLFSASFELVYIDLLILLGYSFVILIVFGLIVKHRGSTFGTKQSPMKNVDIVTADKHIFIEEKNLVIKDLPSMIDSIRQLSDSEYKEATKTSNIFASWLEDNLHAKSVAKKMIGKPRKKVIDILMKYMNR